MSSQGTEKKTTQKVNTNVERKKVSSIFLKTSFCKRIKYHFSKLSAELHSKFSDLRGVQLSVPILAIPSFSPPPPPPNSPCELALWILFFRL